MRHIIIAFAFLGFLGVKSHATVNFSVSTSTFITDSSQGTFVVNSTTFGAIIGIQYGIHAVDSVTGSFADRLYEFAITPRTSFPTAAALRTAIQADVTARNPRADMLAIIILKNNELTRARPLVDPNVSGVDGSTVTPP